MASQSVNVAGRNVGVFDLGVMVAGVVTFVFGFLKFFGSGGSGLSGWESGFFGSFGLSLSFMAALFVLGRVFLGMTMTIGTRFGPAVLAFIVSTVAAVFLLLKLIIGESISGFDLDRKFGLFLALIAAIVQAVVAFLAITSAGETLPTSVKGSGSSS